MTSRKMDPDAILKIDGPPTMQDIGDGVQVPMMNAKVVGHEGARDLRVMMKSLTPSADEGGTEVLGPIHYVLAISDSDDEERPRRCRVLRCSLGSDQRPVVVFGRYPTYLKTDDEGWEEVPDHIHPRPTPTSEMHFEGILASSDASQYRETSWKVEWPYRDFASPNVAWDAFAASLPVGSQPLNVAPDWTMPFWASIRNALSSATQDEGIEGLQLVVVCTDPTSCEYLHGAASDSSDWEDESL